MVERFPRNKTTKLYTVSSRASLLDPGSSLLETTTRLNTMSSRPASRDPVTWGGKICLPQRPEVSFKQATPLHLPNRLQQPNTRQPMGWQSPFATETGGLLQTGNSVASAEQTSSALNKHQIQNPKTPNPRQSAPFIRAYLREPPFHLFTNQHK